ncbi:DUF1553 domain-containing protein [Tautonia marina]|uniref:DUF1553 domain-containing protein n=1 Tax=Tautonia marina TaxID=2653855 RepID=UPI0012607B3E|nr:DUF1553 domain-containing protein [Tautonia marina]
MRLALIVAATLLYGPVAIGQPDAPPAFEFDQSVAPILAARCLDCHSGPDPKGGLDLSRQAGALKGGHGGAAVTPGNLDESLLWIAVEDGLMPPDHPLPEDEAEQLRSWIERGAPWGSDPIDPFAASTDRRAGRDWWSLAPLRRPDLPGLALAEESTPIDVMIRHRLDQQGLQPLGMADRRTLIRRVTFDLTGLPPDPDAVEAFVADDRPDAYERLVDRLLASPQYGVRWARAWLDLARFGESNGFEHDEFRPDAWRYRDWVVQALNADMPYDTFARLQIAGDLLAPDDPSAIEATGFLVAGSYDSVGQGQQSEAMRKVVRQDELEDLVSTVSQTFLGLTVHCARCHDHKFDPIPQTDYYRMAAALDGVRHGVRDLSAIDPDTLAARRRFAALSDRLRALEQPVREQLRTRCSPESLNAVPIPTLRWEFDRGPTDLQGGLPGTLRGGARLDPESLIVDGSSGFLASAPLTEDLGVKTLEAWVRLDDLTQRGGGVVSVQTLDGQTFDAIVFGEQEAGHWMAGSDGFSRTKSFQGPPEDEADRRFVHLALVYEADGTITAYRDGQPYGSPYRSAGLKTFEAGQAQVVFGLRHGEPGGNRMLAGRIARAAVHDRALTAEDVAASFQHGAPIDPQAIAEALPADLRRDRDRLLAERDRVQDRLASTRTAYAVSPREPGTSHRLIRGDPATPAEVVAPGGLSAIDATIPSAFGLDPEAPDAERRTRLAAWISHPENPLFARVIVNRIWQASFGTGLVATPSDFGFNGGDPSHPDVLDWLARDLIEHHWSLKHLHRRILTSSAYRRSSRFDPESAQIDADNRLLWRNPPKRLDAEMVRDAMLAVAGALDPAIGGPGFRDFAIVRAEGTITTHYQPTDPTGPGSQRRTLFRTWARGGRSSFLDALDCPDPSTTAPVRTVTNTPLQALAMLNNAMVLDLSARFADRLESEAGPGLEARIDRAYLLALGRGPSKAERSRAVQVARDHGLATVCRALFNSNEFLFID